MLVEPPMIPPSEEDQLAPPQILTMLGADEENEGDSLPHEALSMGSLHL